jgi:sterol O-acyltransferase
MKVHSYFRAYYYNLEELAKKDDTVTSKLVNEMNSADFRHYIYFVFAPTLLYRPNYPRTNYVRWSKVFAHLMECIMIVMYLYIIFIRFIFPVVRADTNSLKTLIVGSLNSMFPCKKMEMGTYHFRYHCFSFWILWIFTFVVEYVG